MIYVSDGGTMGTILPFPYILFPKESYRHKNRVFPASSSTVHSWKTWKFPAALPWRGCTLDLLTIAGGVVNGDNNGGGNSTGILIDSGPANIVIRNNGEIERRVRGKRVGSPPVSQLHPRG